MIESIFYTFLTLACVMTFLAVLAGIAERCVELVAPRRKDD